MSVLCSGRLCGFEASSNREKRLAETVALMRDHGSRIMDTLVL